MNLLKNKRKSRVFLYGANNEKVLLDCADKLVFHFPPRKHHSRVYSYLYNSKNVGNLNTEPLKLFS